MGTVRQSIPLIVVLAIGGCGRGASEAAHDAGMASIEQLLARIVALESQLAAVQSQGIVDAKRVAAELASVGRDAGLHGPVGDRGPVGPNGPPGPNGPDGPAGVDGPAGPSGLTGDRGPEGPMGPQGIQAMQGPQGLQGPQGTQGPKGQTGPAGAYANKEDLSRHEESVLVGPGLAASAVVKCERATDLLVAGGCSATPMWRAQILVSKPFGATNRSVSAGWRCDYRNTSTENDMTAVAEVLCIRKTE